MHTAVMATVLFVAFQRMLAAHVMNKACHIDSVHGRIRPGTMTKIERVHTYIHVNEKEQNPFINLNLRCCRRLHPL